jgi:hypothetical protein
MWVFCLVSFKFVPRIPEAGTQCDAKKPLILLPFPAVDGQLLASCEPATSNSIDPVRDAVSFPESCGEERDIGSVLERVKRLTLFFVAICSGVVGG